MSRRKQAKPRAFLKLDDKSEKIDDNLSELQNDTKDELSSESGDSSGEELDDDPQQAEQLEQSTNGHGYNKEQDKNYINEAEPAFPSSETNKENECNEGLELGDINDDLNDDDDEVDDEEEDEYGDDDDLHSLESFYSDMYSTHTSSSYSPSISDGTITPNSHLQLTALQHYTQQQQQQHLNEEQQQQHLTSEQHLAGTHHTHTNHSAKLGAYSNNNNNNGTNKTADSSHAEKGADGRRNLPLPKRHGRQKLHYHHHHHQHQAEHLLRLPEKLSKADRLGSGATKLTKLTSDGINKGGSANNVAGSSTEGSYQCQFCDKSFPRLGYLKKHEQSHAEHLPFKCEYCARLFKHKRSRDRHTKLHTGDRRYKCPHCEAAFSRSDHLKIHMKTHDNQKPFQCTVCNRGYNTAAALTSHMQNHKKQAALIAAGGNPQAYNYSPRSAGSGSSSSSLQKRRYALTTPSSSLDNVSHHHHFENAKRPRSNLLKCTFCGRCDFDCSEKLNEHLMSMHDKDQHIGLPVQKPSDAAVELSCEYCTMKFLNIATMFHHMRSTHMDRISSPNAYIEHLNRFTAAAGAFSPRPAPAQQKVVEQIKEEACEPSRQQQQQQGSTEEDEPTDLSQNKQRHSHSPATNSSPTASRDHMTSPTKSAHAPADICAVKPDVFLCNQCNAGLPDFESFRNHLKMHIVQGMQFVCQHCGLTLRDQSDYERHVIAHYLITNIEYACSADGCNKSFSKQEDLHAHLLDAHMAQMVKCNLCGDIFESKAAIQLHFSCAHSAETKLLRCSACMEVFDAEEDFNVHVKSRHQNTLNGASGGGGGAVNANLGLNNLQCIFCRAVCNSELEMHFHLAAHARQFRCPSCPETFHVEFLLDRHMQTHHGEQLNAGVVEHMPAPQHSAMLNNNNNNTSNNNNNNHKDRYEDAHAADAAKSNPLKSLYANSFFGGKSPLLSLPHHQNNNNNLLDYNVAFAAVHLNKGLFHNEKHYNSPLQVDTGVMKHPGFMYGLGHRYFDTNRALLDMYAAQQQQEKLSAAPAPPSGGQHYFISPGAGKPKQPSEHHNRTPVEMVSPVVAGFSCGMCERNDFRTETELHSHRKIVHNMKTGVSLRCAYCSGNFKSRSELEHHMKTCHNSTGKHKCLICDEIFPSPAILAEHKLQHSKVGQSGKCSHCAKPLLDVSAFKEHFSEHNADCHQLPVQCICCRQTLHSEFEIGLHARFHTKSLGVQEHACAMCLEPIGGGANKDAKICESCCRKHKLSTKYSKHQQQQQGGDANQGYAADTAARQIIENRCNLCQMVLPTAAKLQEHLVEHTFAGCEERGFNCYICSAVFTASNGLLSHMLEHGLNARPYDCNLCTEKFYFRAELEHHLVEHEHDSHKQMRGEREKRESEREQQQQAKEHNTSNEQHFGQNAEEAGGTADVKQELFENDEDGDDADIAAAAATNAGDDDEYIEVEKIAELANTESGTEHSSRKATD